MKEDLNSVGSTWIGVDKLLNGVMELTGTNINLVQTGIYELVEQNLIVSDANEWFSFFEVDKNETLIASKVKEMLKGEI